MGISLALLASVGSAVSAGVGLIKGIQDRNEAKDNARRAAAEQAKVRSETAAQQAARASEERRAQIREERVRRARVIAGAVGSGGSASSGEFGAIGGLSTNLATNVGINAGRLQAGENISQFSQNAADFTGKANQNLADANQADQLFNLSTSIFSASGGVSQIKSIFDTPDNSTDFSKVDYQKTRDK